MNETRIDRFLDGKLTLHQPIRGHRAGTDALLVAACAGPAAGDLIVDAGSGVGTIGLALALRAPEAVVKLLEREPELAALARLNIDLNAVDDRTSVLEADLLDSATLGPLRGSATLIVSNPPFYEAGTVRASPHRLKANAYGLDRIPGAVHGDWIRGMLALARPHARIVLIHRPEALPALLEAVESRLGGIRVLPVLPRDGAAAIRILFGGTVASRAPFGLAAPLVLHGRDGAFTRFAAEVGRGEAIIPLFDAANKKSRPVRPALS